MVVCPQNTLLIQGVDGAAKLISAIDARLKPGGLLIFNLNGLPEASRSPPAFGLSDLTPAGLGARFGKATGYIPMGSRVRPPKAESAEDDAAYLVSSVWSWRKGPGRVDARALALALQPAVTDGPVDVTAKMRAKDWISGKPGNWRLAASDEPGHALFGPYVALAQGRYEARIDVRATPVGEVEEDAPLLRVEVACGDEALVMHDFAADDLTPGVVGLSFATPPGGVEAFEIRLVHFGRADMHIGRVVLGPAVEREAKDAGVPQPTAT